MEVKRRIFYVCSFLIVLLAVPMTGTPQTPTGIKGELMGQLFPEGDPELFAPGIVSVDGRYEYGMGFSPRGDVLYFTVEYPDDAQNDGLEGLLVVRRLEERWTEPSVADLRGDRSWEQEAFFTLDGNRVFFATNVSQQETKLWFIERQGEAWAKARQLDSPVNTKANRVFYATFTRTGTMYFTNVDERKIYRALLVDGAYPNVELVDVPGGHAFVAPDESFLLLDTGGDLHVAFRDEGGGWRDPVPLSEGFCSESWESCPSLSPDGRWIFFSRYNEPGELSNIYWASSAIIEKLRPNSKY
jgi:hypothetical protein